MKLNPKILQIRDFNLTDLESYLNYFYHSPKGFLSSISVDEEKFPTQTFMRTRMEDLCHKFPNVEGSQNPALSIVYDLRPAGVHPLNELTPGESAAIHAHIYKPELRKIGLGSVSLPIAAKIFIERFKLKRLMFKIPLQNAGGLRVLEKLQIREVGKETLNLGIVKAGTAARAFELKASEVDDLLNRCGIKIKSTAPNQWVVG